MGMSGLLPSVWMRLEEQLPSTPIGYVGVPLGGGEIGVSEHLLNRPQVGSALEQMRCEGVPQEVGVDAARLEACGGGELAQDEKRARARERAALGIEE